MTYPELAREITALRKAGDIAGALSKAQAAPEEQRRLPEVRGAIAWCFYDRDIKPCRDPSISVTPTMLDAAQEALKKIHTWCNADRTSRYSAFPVALLGLAKALKAAERDDDLRALLDCPEALEFSSESDAKFPSHRDQWLTLVFDSIKRLLDVENPTRARYELGRPLLDALEVLETKGGLSNVKQTLDINGQKRKIPSHRQRYYLARTKYLLETEQFDDLIKVADRALAQRIFHDDTNIKWIVYRLTLALVQRDPSAALTKCDEFLTFEFRPYSLLLKAEILQKLGRTEEALRAVANSLQIISQRDLPYIGKNLLTLADLSSDLEVKRAHIQMARSIRHDEGHPPAKELETRAKELGLGDPGQPPSAAELRKMWDVINPSPQKAPRKGNRPKPHGLQRTQTGGGISSTKVSRKDLASYDHNCESFGDVRLAPVTQKDGENKVRPVVVIGMNGTTVLISPLFTNPEIPNAQPLQTWQQAGLKTGSVWVPTFHSIDETRLMRPIGKLAEPDLSMIRTSLKS